jgi:hypothetical protein
MRRTVLAMLGSLFIAGSTAQIAAATEHHARTGSCDDRSNYCRAYNQSNQPFYRASHTTGRPNIEEFQKMQDLEWGCGWPFGASANGG